MTISCTCYNKFWPEPDLTKVVKYYKIKNLLDGKFLRLKSGEKQAPRLSDYLSADIKRKFFHDFTWDDSPGNEIIKDSDKYNLIPLVKFLNATNYHNLVLVKVYSKKKEK